MSEVIRWDIRCLVSVFSSEIILPGCGWLHPFASQHEGEVCCHFLVVMIFTFFSHR